MTIPAVAPEMIEAPPHRAEGPAEEGSSLEETGFAAYLAQAAADDAMPDEGGEGGQAAAEELLALLAPVEDEAEIVPEADLPLAGQVVALAAPVTQAAATAATDVREVEVPLEAEAARAADEAVRGARLARLAPEQASSQDAVPLDDEVLAPAVAEATAAREASEATATREAAAEGAEAATRPVAEAPLPVQEAPVGTRTATEGREAAAVAPLAEANAQAGSEDSGSSRDPGQRADATTNLAALPNADESGRAGGAFELPADLTFTPPTSGSDVGSAHTSTPPPVVPGLGPVVPSLTPTEAPVVPPSGAPAEALPVHVEWLTARGGGSARLQLHPANLGEVEVNVNVRGNAVDVVIRALEPAAQAAVAQTRELLVDGLANQDLRMEQFEVRGANDEPGARSSGQERERPGSAGDFGKPSDTHDRGRGGAGDPSSGSSPDLADAAPTLPPTHRAASGVDVHV